MTLISVLAGCSHAPRKSEPESSVPFIEACYETALGKDPKLEGKVVIQWLIVQGGKVSYPSVFAKEK
jgi:hypothetical protein